MQRECRFFTQNFLLANHDKVVMIAYSFREVRPAIDGGFNEVMKWIGRSPVERAAAALPNLRRRCAWRTANRRPTLRRDRAVEVNGLTKKIPVDFFHAWKSHSCLFVTPL